MAKRVQVRVKPNSGRQAISIEADGSLVIHLKSPPVDGKANEELIRVLAKQFDVPQRCIHIKAGASSRLKLVDIED